MTNINKKRYGYTLCKNPSNPSQKYNPLRSGTCSFEGCGKQGKWFADVVDHAHRKHSENKNVPRDQTHLSWCHFVNAQGFACGKQYRYTDGLKKHLGLQATSKNSQGDSVFYFAHGALPEEGINSQSNLLELCHTKPTYISNDSDSFQKSIKVLSPPLPSLPSSSFSSPLPSSEDYSFSDTPEHILSPDISSSPVESSTPSSPTNFVNPNHVFNMEGFQKAQEARKRKTN